jgi:hypothetical protein
VKLILGASRCVTPMLTVAGRRFPDGVNPVVVSFATVAAAPVAVRFVLPTPAE